MRRGRPPGVKKVVAAEPGFQFDEPITQLAWFLAPPGQGLSGKTAIVDNIVLKTFPEPSMLLLFEARQQCCLLIGAASRNRGESEIPNLDGDMRRRVLGS